MNTEAMKAKLEALAKEEIGSDEEDFVAYDWYGSNVDDAYWGGASAGETQLARALLKEFFS